MQKLLISLVLSCLFLGVSAQETQKDTIAVMILQRMSDVIGDLTSVSFNLMTSIDVDNYQYGTIKQFNHDEVYMVGPDKMLIHEYGYKGHRGFWYNGQTITYYLFDENNFAVIPAPDNIIATIDSVHHNYGIDFPAADFFYPTFTADVLDYFDNVIFLGKKVVDGQECFHILATNEDKSAQFWIANDAFNLPKKFVLTYKNKNNAQYESTFSKWDLNPDIPVSAFEFLPPPGATEIYLMPR
jgi:hypothetical protein